MVVTNAELRAMGFSAATDQRNIWFRPGVREALKTVSTFADNIVWTLADHRLAQLVVSRLDVDGHIKAIIGTDRECQTFVARTASDDIVLRPSDHMPSDVQQLLSIMQSPMNRPLFQKDLALLGHTMTRVVLVDDTPDVSVLHPYNLLPVPGFRHTRKEDAKDDVMQQRVLPLLEQCARPGTNVCAVLASYGLATVSELLKLRFNSQLQTYCELVQTHRQWSCPETNLLKAEPSHAADTPMQDGEDETSSTPSKPSVDDDAMVDVENDNEPITDDFGWGPDVEEDEDEDGNEQQESLVLTRSPAVRYHPTVST